MIAFIKKYWDIFGGVITGVGLTIIAKMQLEKVQLYYSIIILILVSIGVLKIIKQTLENRKKDRKHNILDDMVDGQKPVKAIRLAQEPTKDGENIGKLIITTIGGLKRVMNKLKELFDKFKGYLLTFALTVLTVIEQCGGFINGLCGDKLAIKGVEVLPIVTLVAAVIVGILSNGYTKDQKEKIKALFAKSTTDELVVGEIKKTLKEDNAKLAQFNKILATKENELANLNSALESAKNTHNAKIAMFNMVPQLATTEDVQLAANEVVNAEAKIREKAQEIEETKKSIEYLTTTINALKSQL